MPTRFKPFNIMNLQGNLYVAYAVREDDGDDEVAGEGLGFVDVFDADGFLIERVASRGKLNAPWGMAIAPAGFGRFSNHLLVGNNGDGRINAYDLKNFTFDGQLGTQNGRSLTIDGLWGSRSATASSTSRPTRCSSPRARTKRSTGCSERSRRNSQTVSQGGRRAFRVGSTDRRRWAVHR